MSASNLPDPQQAYDTIFHNVHAKVFFHKCAAAGYSPRTHAEATHMLETAGKLRAISESAQVKQASARENPYFQLNANLDAVMTQYGLAEPRQSYQEAEVGYKQAASHLMGDFEIYNAVLSLKAAEYAQEQQAFG